MSQKIASPTDSAVAENDAPQAMLPIEEARNQTVQTTKVAKQHWEHPEEFIALKNAEFSSGVPSYTGF